MLGEFFFEFGSQLVDVGGLAETLHLLSCGFHIDPRVLTQFLQHLQHHRELLLGKHTHLEIKVSAPLGLASHAILAD